MQNNTNRIFIKNASVRCSLKTDLMSLGFVRVVPELDLNNIPDANKQVTD